MRGGAELSDEDSLAPHPSPSATGGRWNGKRSLSSLQQGRKQGISRIPADSGKTVPKSAAIRGGSGQIPYAGEQGTNSADQGMKVPCSAENRDISRRPRRPFDALRGKRGRPKRRAQRCSPTRGFHRRHREITRPNRERNRVERERIGGGADAAQHGDQAAPPPSSERATLIGLRRSYSLTSRGQGWIYPAVSGLRARQRFLRRSTINTEKIGWRPSDDRPNRKAAI